MCEMENKRAAYEDFTLLADGKNAFPEIIRCIENAESSVEINMFIWRDDEIGNRVANAVLKAANGGARVCISVDRYGVVLEKSEEARRSFFHKRQTLKEKLKSKILMLGYPKNRRRGRVRDEETELYKAIISHPNITVSRDVFKADHSKYYIIDDKILFVGGINIEDKENGKDIRGREYGDYMVKLTGTEYVTALRTKLRTGENISADYFFGVNTKAPLPHRFEMEQKYLDMISSSKKRLHITMAYFSPLENFMSAILDAYKRGVDISIVIPSCANYQDDTNKKTVRTILKTTNGGIRVYLSPKMLHTKLIATEEYISFGSTNITKKAFHQLSELNLFVKNTESDFCNAIKAGIERDINESTKISSYKEIKYNRLYTLVEGRFI